MSLPTSAPEVMVYVSAGSASPYVFDFDAAVTVIACRPTVTVVADDDSTK